MFVERKIPWHLSIGGKAERYDRLKLVPDLYGIREGKRPSGCDSLPSLPGLLVHPRKRRPNAWSVAIEKVRGNEPHVGLGRIGCRGGCAGQRRHVERASRFPTLLLAAFEPTRGGPNTCSPGASPIPGRQSDRESLSQSKKNLHP